MTSPTPQQLAQSGTLEDLYKQLEPIRLGAGWAKPTPSLWAEPKKSFQPFVWSYAQAKGALDAAGRLINTELAERRNLIMQNPAGGSYATSRTIVAAYQMIMPGEKARSHRHTPNALRLIIDAEPGAYTIVNGERLSMMPGDVVLTPNWCWHGHGNDSRVLRLLARRAGRAAGAIARADVLRAASRRVREGERGGERLADAFLLGRHRAPARRSRVRARTGSLPKSRSAQMAAKNPRSTPWRCR